MSSVGQKVVKFSDLTGKIVSDGELVRLVVLQHPDLEDGPVEIEAAPSELEAVQQHVTDVVTFVSVGIIGGAIIQYPLGSLSDRWDRRMVLLITTCCALISALGLVILAGSNPVANFAFVFVFGSFAMPLFSLSAAHANDRAGKGEFVLVNAALMLFYSLGAICGPLAASWFMQRNGPASLFIFAAAVYGVFILITLHRMRARGSVPAGQRGQFINLLRTSAVFSRLARRNGGEKSSKHD